MGKLTYTILVYNYISLVFGLLMLFTTNLEFQL